MMNDHSVRLDLFDLLAAHRARHDSSLNKIRRIDAAEVRELLMTSCASGPKVSIAEIDTVRFGLHAFDLARDFLLMGDSDRGAHWLSVAAKLGIDEAKQSPDERLADALSLFDTFDVAAAEVVGEDVLLHALIRAKKAAEAACEDSEAKFEKIFSFSSVGMAISNLDGTLVRTNRALADILDHRRGPIPARRLEELFHPDDAEYLRLRYEVLLEGDSLPFREQRRLLRADGEAALVILSASVLRDPDGSPRYHVTSVEDVSEKQFLEAQLQFQAMHDPLTGLANRNRFLGLFEEAVRGDRTADEVTFFHVDLDGFRTINNGVGREAGDCLLQSVATKLRQVFDGETATIARFDGDQFGVLLEHRLGMPSIATLAEQINDDLAEPVYLAGRGIAMTATIAVAHRPPPDVVVTELLRATDTTLQRLKASGRRQWGMTDSEANERDRDRFALAASMPGAWESGEIGIDFQPLVAVKDTRLMGVQARLRWDHAEQGQLDHAQCFEVLGETGLSGQIGRWVLTQACEHVRMWSDRLHDHLPNLYVELSRELASDPDLVSAVRTVLNDAALEPGQLQLGMSVQALCMTDGLAEDNLDVLVDLGISVVLCGFGTTRGDLACLEDLPVRAVKMSELVVSRVNRMGDDALFTRSIRQLVPLVRESGIAVIVGDVQTAAQFDWWREVGADIVQGDFSGTVYTPETCGRMFVA